MPHGKCWHSLLSLATLGRDIFAECIKNAEQNSTDYGKVHCRCPTEKGYDHAGIECPGFTNQCDGAPRGGDAPGCKDEDGCAKDEHSRNPCFFQDACRDESAGSCVPSPALVAAARSALSVLARRHQPPHRGADRFFASYSIGIEVADYNVADGIKFTCVQLCAHPRPHTIMVVLE